MPKAPVKFFEDEVKAPLKDRLKLKSFISGMVKKEGRKFGSLNVIFCSDEQLLLINRDFLKHDYYTDIITFDLSESEDLIGEVYISIDRVRDNAKQFQVSVNRELLRVIFHGILHLLGYGDKKPADQVKMRKKETLYVDRFLRST